MRIRAILRYMACVLFLGFFSLANLAAQDPAIKRIAAEAARLRESYGSPDSDLNKATLDAQDRTSDLNDAIRDWITLRLPKTKAALDVDYARLQSRLNSELSHAGVLPPAGGVDEYGYVGRVELLRPPEFHDALIVVAGITVPCGSSDSLYVYDYTNGSARRVLDSRGNKENDMTVRNVYFSKPDASGGRIILTLRNAIQCGSFWNELSYDLFRLNTGESAAVPIFSGKHSVWFGADRPYNVQLKPDELLLELRDRSIDSGLHNRTHVLRYTVGPAEAKRIDPVALQPQDFVEEWLTRSWTEMESRSSSADRSDLEKWHELLGGDFDAGRFNIVQSCKEKPDNWQVALTLEWAADKKLAEPLTRYFLVHGLGKYRFEMAAISSEPQAGCPGEAAPNSNSSPSLFETDPKKKITAPVVPF